MTMKMKGLLKGLRYISQIFDEEEEQELQIGNPTDVKHVAHIGWDGPTASAPSWIDKFKGEGDAAGDVNNGQDQTTETSTKRKSDKSKGSRRKGGLVESSENKTQGSDCDPSLASEPPVVSEKKERSSRRKKTKASSSSTSKTSSKSKNPSNNSPDNGLPYSDNGKTPKAGKETRLYE